MRGWLTVWCLLMVPLNAGAQPLPRADAVPGGVAVVRLGPATQPAPRAYFDAERVMVVRSDDAWHAVVGLTQKLPTGTHALTVIDEGGNKRSVDFTIQSKEYGVQRITLKNKRQVDPSESDLKRITQEQTVIRAVFARFTEIEAPPLRFDLPAPGRLSGVFGTRRIFNEQERQPHAGIDIAAARGTPALAPAEGVVVNTGDYFFNGKTVFVDHGQGLISMFNHLDRIAVTEGQTLKRGQRLGDIGMSGRATGPHLHWTISLNNARVDPMLFLSDEAAKRIRR